MKPRLSSSKKWTAFPKDYLQQIEDVFKQNFAAQLANAKLVIEGRIYPEEILLRVGFQENGRLAQPNFEVSMNYKQKKTDALQSIHDCIDAAASMMDEYFQTDGEADFPLSWKEYDFNGKTLSLQFTTENSTLEAEADKLLGKEFKELLTEEAPTDDALDRADDKLKTDSSAEDEAEEFYGSEGEDDEGESEDTPKGPTMFGGKNKKKKENLH
jgi:hypothetical protein